MSIEYSPFYEVPKIAIVSKHTSHNKAEREGTGWLSPGFLWAKKKTKEKKKKP
jgi:hypothetical protein